VREGKAKILARAEACKVRLKMLGFWWLEDEEEDNDGFDFARGSELHEGLCRHYDYAAAGQT